MVLSPRVSGSAGENDETAGNGDDLDFEAPVRAIRGLCGKLGSDAGAVHGAISCGASVPARVDGQAATTSASVANRSAMRAASTGAPTSASA